MDYDAASQDRWQAHPWLSRVTRVLIFLVPTSLGVALSLTAAHIFPPSRLGMNKWVWWVLVGFVSTFVLVSTDRLARRLMPLTALWKMTLIFPDRAPSRFGLAMRTGTTKQLERLVEQSAVATDVTLSGASAMLELVAALGVHDRLTRGHCERVRAYTDLVIAELHLSEHDANLLRWASLLHDVGKLRVPQEILTSDKRPTDRQWEILATHPAEGMALTESLSAWLGEWRRTIGEHHERWDGQGYPLGLSQVDIHLGARIVAVTDAFDVMTSARSYKRPIPASKAREEIARCASTQFDPTVVRAFLNVGLRRLRFALGPLAWFSNLPGLGSVPTLSVVSNSVGAMATASALTVAAVTGAPTTLPPPAKNTAVAAPSSERFAVNPIAAVTPTVPKVAAVEPAPLQPRLTAADVNAAGNIDEPLVIAVHGLSGSVLTIELSSAPKHGQVLISRHPSLASDETWTGELVYVPTMSYVGTDDVRYKVCDALTTCAEGLVHISVGAAQPRAVTQVPPTDTTTTQVPTTTSPTPLVTPPSTTIAPTTVPPTSTVPTTTTPPTTTTLPATAPVAAADVASGIEDQTLVLALADLVINDSDINSDPLTIATVQNATNSTVQLIGAFAVFVSDSDYFGDSTFIYTVCDPGNLCSNAQVTVSVAPVPDAPRPASDDYATIAVTPLHIAAPGLLANDLEPDGETMHIDITQPNGLSGSVVFYADGSFDYVSSSLFSGQDVGTYSVCDPGGLCSQGTFTITVSPVPITTQTLYLTGTGPSAGKFSMSTSSISAADPEPDTDGDGQPGLTILKNAISAASWSYELPASMSTNGPIILDLFSKLKDPGGARATLVAELLACDTGGANCITLLQRQWTFQPWNLVKNGAWTERQLTLGTISATFGLGQVIVLLINSPDRDVLFAFSGGRPTALQFTL